MNSNIISFAIQAHQNTNHLYDGYPYSVHLAMVAMFAQKYIECIPEQDKNDVLSACWLHDTIEDCRLTYNDIKKVAGERVADIVYAVTNEKGKNRKERANDEYYLGIRSTPWAKYVKLCDRLANVLYSLQNGSSMYAVYQKEHDSFMKALFPKEIDMNQYKDIISHLNELLQHSHHLVCQPKNIT